MFVSRVTRNVFTSFALLNLIFVIKCDIANEPNSFDSHNQTKWIAELFSEGEKNFDMNIGVNEKCRRDFQLYKLHLQNQSIWAIRMMESSEWPKTGIFSGMTQQMGNFGECLLVSNYDVKGKYCFVGVKYDIGQRGISINESQSQSDSVWKTLQKNKKENWKINRLRLNWALCVPASCQSEDVTVSLNQTLYPLFRDEGFSINVYVNPKLCSVEEDEPPSLDFYIALVFFAVIIGFLSIATVHHYLKNGEKSDVEKVEKRFWCEIFKAASVLENYKKLIKVSLMDAPFVYLMKFVYMVIVTVGHRLLHIFSHPKHNPEYIEMTIFSSDANKMAAGVYSTGYALVETFFMISGFILFYYGFSRARKEGWSHIVQIIVVRWGRMVPAVIAIMVFSAYIMPNLNSGPLWNEKVDIMTENCEYSFWYNVFGVGNIFGTDRQCMFNMWYVSADLQLSVVGCILLFICARNEIAGLVSISATALIGVVLSFVTAYKNSFHGMLPVYMSEIDLGNPDLEFQNFYMLSYSRLTSYVVGCATGYAVKKLKEKKIAFSDRQALITVVILIPLKLLFIWYVPTLIDFYNEYDRVNAALHAAIIRTVYVLPEALNLCSYYTNSAALVYKPLNMKVWVPLGRLLYCMYLISVVLQFFQVASYQDLMPTFGYIPIIWYGAADLLISIGAAFILHLFIEAPIGNMMKVVVQRVFNIWFGVADVIFSFAAAFVLHLFIEAPLGNMSKVIIPRYIK